MAEVTYFVALPFVIADNGVAAGEPTECFKPYRGRLATCKVGHSLKV